MIKEDEAFILRLEFASLIERGGEECLSDPGTVSAASVLEDKLRGLEYVYDSASDDAL